MRPDDAAAPDPQAPAPELYQLNATSPQPFSINFNATAAAAFHHLLALRASGALAELPPVASSVLLLLVMEIDGRYLPRLVASCSHGWLADQTRRSYGHVTRALRVLAHAGLLIRLKRGGGTQASRYQLLANGAPARRVSARQRAILNSALARGYGARMARQRAKTLRASAPFARDTLSLDSVVVVQTTTETPEAAAAAAAVVAKVLTDGGVPAADLPALVRLPNATEAQAQIAVANLRAQRTKVRNVGAFVRRAIEEKWGPPPTAEQRRRERLPDHVASDEARAREERAAAAARERVIDQVLRGMTDDEVERIRADVAAATTHALHRAAILKSDPRRSAAVRDEVFRRCHPARPGGAR